MAIEEDEAPGIPEWVVTFGDMMSLLLTFFIMLVSLSEIKEEERFQAMVESFRKQFGHDASSVSVISGENKPRNSQMAKLATMGRAKRFNIMKGGDKVSAPVGDHPRVRIVRAGTRTSIGTVIHFPEQSAELTDSAEVDLQLQLENMGGKPQKIEVRGHTSRRPVAKDSNYRDNWDLAFERSRAVKDFLIQHDVDPRRIRISVAGPHEPIHLGADPSKMKQNPRVEVYLLDEIVDDFAGNQADRDRRFAEDEAFEEGDKKTPTAPKASTTLQASEPEK